MSLIPSVLKQDDESVGFLGGSDGKGSACNVGDLGLIPGLGRSPGEQNSYPPQYSGLKIKPVNPKGNQS